MGKMDAIILGKQFVKLLIISKGEKLGPQPGISVKELMFDREKKGLVQELSEL